MPVFVALLRGINVGGRRKVPMARLREVCGELGFAGAATYIQSGNAAFSAAGSAESVAKRLEAAFPAAFGFECEVIVRTAAAWATYAAGSPFPEEETAAPERLYLFLTRRPPLARAEDALRAAARNGERIECRGDAVWIHFPAGVADSKLTSPVLDRCLGSTATGRNWKTVVAVRELAAGVGPGGTR